MQRRRVYATRPAATASPTIALATAKTTAAPRDTPRRLPPSPRALPQSTRAGATEGAKQFITNARGYNDDDVSDDGMEPVSKLFAKFASPYLARSARRRMRHTSNAQGTRHHRTRHGWHRHSHQTRQRRDGLWQGAAELVRVNVQAPAAATSQAVADNHGATQRQLRELAASHTHIKPVKDPIPWGIAPLSWLLLMKSTLASHTRTTRLRCGRRRFSTEAGSAGTHCKPVSVPIESGMVPLSAL